ncbi:hypothetical protein [Methanolobus sp. ZRKC5]|uniref:hypothetical protein n=1 Tax=unclassified Methanolobus TaxID=2629569 RepID=UPI00313C0A1E
MFCSECGSQLFFGKGSDYQKIWCATCEGLKILSKEESKNVLNEDIKKSGQEIKRLINLFEAKSLLPILFVTREGYLLPVLDGRGPNFRKYVVLTELISKVIIEGSKGSQICNPLDSNFQKLIHLTNMKNVNLRLRSLINDNLGSVLLVPANKVQDITLDFEIGKIVNRIKMPEPTNSNVIEVFKFHDDWKDIMQNYNDNGFISATELYNNQINNIRYDAIIEEHLEALNLKTSLELSMNNHNLLKQDKFKNNLEYTELLVKLSQSFLHTLEVEKQTPLEFECSLTRVSKKKFKKIIKINGFNVQRTYDLLVSQVGDKINYPLIYADGSKLLVPPLTLGIFAKLLKALYSQEFKDKLSEESYIFEDKVCKILEDIGLKTDQPNDATKKLVNIEDLDNPGNFEIDIVAYSYQTEKLFVIDCKHVFITSEFISGTREQTIIKKFKEQPAKQRRRIEYIKNNLKRFGFDSSKIKKYVSVLITANKEPIDVLENCHIVSIREIEKIKNLEPL